MSVDDVELEIKCVRDPNQSEPISTRLICEIN